jgi:RNA recognition motif-containing protein
LNGKTLDNGKTISATTFEKYRKPQFNNIYVKDFPQGTKMSNDEFIKTFSTYGEIVSAVIMPDTKEDNQGNAGFGFICFKTPEAADKLMSEGHKIGEHPLYITRALTKE